MLNRWSGPLRRGALRWLGAWVAASAASAPLTAQTPQAGSLRDSFLQLFRFGGTECGPSILFCLVNSSGASAAEAFSTNANATASSLTQFVRSSIGQGIANVPTPSTGSGSLFRLSEAGVPVRDDEQSSGPIFGERPITLGRGKWLAGVNTTNLSLERLRDTPIDGIAFNIAQRDLPPGGGILGDPPIEETYLHVETHLGLAARVTNVFVTYGLFDNLDVGLTVPLVQAAISGYSDAQIVPGRNTDPAAGFSFGGPPEDPRLATRSVVERNSATGIGDIAVRAKLRLTPLGGRFGAALLADARLPTGRSDDFLGSGAVWVRTMGIVAFRVGGGLMPHLNAGYYYRSGTAFQDALLLNVGFDQRLSDRLTIASDLLAQRTRGANPLTSEQIVIVGQSSFLTSNIPTRRDDAYDGTIGLKYSVGSLTGLVNAIVPLNSGGLRGGILWTAGVQMAF